MATGGVRTVVTLALVAAVFTVPSASAGSVEEVHPPTPAPSPQTDVTIEDPSDLWFVELVSPPSADGTPAAGLRREKQHFRATATEAGIVFTERFAFDTLWNGLSVRVDPTHVPRLSRLDGVKAVWPVALLEAPPTDSMSPAADTAVAMTGADVVRSELGLTGAGIKVGIIDSGIDYNHPDLGGCFGPGCRVETGWDFVGDDFDVDSPESAKRTPQPDPDPMDDCDGHGTHVAGIAGARAAGPGGVTGVAPGVTFGAYRVWGCAGTSAADIVLAAMEMAHADGMNVVNLSLGLPFQWPQYPLVAAGDRLGFDRHVNRGTVVVASAGNQGADGVYAVDVPAVGRKVIGVASFDNSHINAPFFVVNPSGQQVLYRQMAVTPDPPTSGDSDDVVYVGRGCTDPFDPYLADPAGKVALIDRGVCTFEQKYQRAVDAGATAIVVANNVPGLVLGLGITPRPPVPGVLIDLEDGNHIKALLDAGETVNLTWMEGFRSVPNPTGGLISSFSSYGPSPELDLKPDIGAPGGLIRSTYPLAQGGYATLNGTSMATPHVAGAAALVLEAKPNLSSQTMRTVLQNSAVPALFWGNPGLGFLDNVHRQGAGMVNIPEAVNATSRIEPGKLSLGESEAGPATETLTIENGGDDAVTYSLSHTPALSTFGSTFTPSFSAGFASVAFSSASVTVPAGGQATVDVTITANPALPDRSLYGGYILAGGDDGSTYRVPYAGFKGDYQSIVVLNPAASPFGSVILRRTLTPGPSENVTINPDAGEVAWVAYHLDHQVRHLRIEMKDAATGQSWGRALTLDYVARSSGPSDFSVAPIDGITTRGASGRLLAVPNGTYALEVKVLKALGDPDNPDHWETWTSPTTVTIARP